jgi:XTP/dITP diphosphohydrolase
MQKIILATNNLNKLREFRQIIKNFEIVSLKEAGIFHETIEDSDTFAGNALKKAREIAEISGLPTIAEDSGIVVDALGGAPGVYSARFALDEYDGADIDNANNDKLLRLMKNERNRKARFVSTICYYRPDGTYDIVEGALCGEIAHEKKGAGGFGYDVIFYLPEYGTTSADIAAEEKNRISHRAKAIEKLPEIFREE